MVSRLESLPEEVVADIFLRLNRAEQYHTALASWRCYHQVVPHLYRAIELVDCRNEATKDEHDDTPMIRILLVLVKNPYLASKVQDLTHRCHARLPDAYLDLPTASFLDPNISNDGRTLRLLSLATRNLVNVRTLRIIYGHHNISLGLLQGFFSKARNHQHRVARLWLESCCLEGLVQRVGVYALLGGLQSLRVRRLRVKTETSRIGVTIVWGRVRTQTAGEMWRSLTLVNNNSIPPNVAEDSPMATKLNEAIYEQFPGVEGPVESQDGVNHVVEDLPWLDRPYDLSEEPAWMVAQFATTSSSTLTSLNLDWVLDVMPLIEKDWINHLTFPKLRAFQVRNAVSKAITFDPNTPVALLEGNWLHFLKRHPQLQCLSWPLEHFLHLTAATRLTSRAEDVVLTLGRTLKELRVDADVIFRDDVETALMRPTGAGNLVSPRAASRRRIFIEQVAPHLFTLEVLKIEGGVPFDERSEIVRAVRFSPLRKLVVIGVHFPPIDTWARLRPAARDALTKGSWKTHSDDSQDHLVAKDWTTLQAEASSSPSQFIPMYNPSKYSLLETIALHHASTITSLKLCGFRDAVDIHSPTHFRSFILAPLQHLHHLRHLTISFALRTNYMGRDVGNQIRSYWSDAESPNSTALAMPAEAYAENPWARVLVDDYAPVRLAANVAALLTPSLSRQALASDGGMSIKALVLLGGHEIFGLDVRLDARGEVLSYRGPKSENDADKVREKMERRAWF